MKRYFVSKAGSRVTVSGKYMGIFEIEFDWVEEPGGCVEMHPTFNGHLQDDPQISASCDCHGTVYVSLLEVPQPLKGGR